VAAALFSIMKRSLNRRKGVVVQQNASFSDRPIVRILEENGHEINPYEINLEKELSIVVTGCDTTFKKG
jgi:hypothetical protein